MKRVMLVEDEELILQGIRNIIDWEKLGLDVVHMAHNGKEALSLWEKEPVDLVVTDVEMPVMNGLNLLKEIRSRDERVRFVILTGYDEFEYARKAIQLDVEDYILKPIDEVQLETVVKNALIKLQEMDRDKAKNMEDRIGWQKFLDVYKRQVSLCTCDNGSTHGKSHRCICCTVCIPQSGQTGHKSRCSLFPAGCSRTDRYTSGRQSVHCPDCDTVRAYHCFHDGGQYPVCQSAALKL